MTTTEEQPREAMAAQIEAMAAQIEALAPDACGAVSEDAIAHLAIRDQLNRTIYKAVRSYRMGNMSDAEDHSCAYPLVDLMSNPAPADIGTGEMAMIALADEIAEAVRTNLPAIVTALRQAEAAPGVVEAEREEVAMRVARAFFGENFDPFTNPESFDICQTLADAALARQPTASPPIEVERTVADGALVGAEDDVWPGDAKYQKGETVEKKGRASWRGKIVGWYRTDITALGYAVESAFEPGSVQIYPESALVHWLPAAQATDEGAAPC